HPSYYSDRTAHKLDHEIQGLRSVSGDPVESSRQHFLKFRLPDTFLNLASHGIQHDYSMGYAPQPGFRAGTSRPFYFFDVVHNTATTLLMHPITVMEGTYKDYLHKTPSQSIQDIRSLIDTVREHGGTFMSIWHEAQLTDSSPWRKVYTEMNDYLRPR
ncbi:MAG: hypothetical protein V4616_14575, partial [Bacteroidota bacterium]